METCDLPLPSTVHGQPRKMSMDNIATVVALIIGAVAGGLAGLSSRRLGGALEKAML